MFLRQFGHAEPPPLLTPVNLYSRSEGNPLFLRAMLDQLIQRNLVFWNETGWHLDKKFEAIACMRRQILCSS